MVKTEKKIYKTGLGAWELITQGLLMEVNGPDTMKFQDELTISMGHRQKKKKKSSVSRIVLTNAKEMIHMNKRIEKKGKRQK